MLFTAIALLVAMSDIVDAMEAGPGLIDPLTQPLFEVLVPNPLDPSFVYDIATPTTGGGDGAGEIEVSVGRGTALTGLIDPTDGTTPLVTPIWGYGIEGDTVGYTWPGRTFVWQSYQPLTVRWHNRIDKSAGYLLTGKDNSHLNGVGAIQTLKDFDFSARPAVDDSFHWAYSLEGYEQYTIETHGTPIVPHLHGGHSDAPYDGNPEYFFAPEFGVRGPHFTNNTYVYDNSQPAATLWYHDHALGITRLNVYSGMAGFYILRDEQDTGKVGNPLGLPAYPYEIPLAIQDRMFKENGELFYPSFYGDPYWTDFLQDASFGEDDASAMAEMFGDFMVVNGKIWPKMEVEPRNYRLRFLNGCDSRFLAVEFIAVELNATSTEGGTPVKFWVVGADQGLGTPSEEGMVVIGPAQRYDIIFDFRPFANRRIIIKNTGGDAPFGGDIPGPQDYELTDRIMAFDVVENEIESIPDEWAPPAAVQSTETTLMDRADKTRRIGLFEGHDQFGRLQHLLGTIGPAFDKDGEKICYPCTDAYKEACLAGKQMDGTQTWHAPTTENIELNAVEDWEIWNLSADAHPIHLHLVKFQLVKREYIKYDEAAIETDGELEQENIKNAKGDGTYFTDKPLIQHDGSLGEGYITINPTKDTEHGEIPEADYKIYVDHFPKDVIVGLPGQITTIRAKFDKPGRYNHHCHILAHEDHEMMRLFHVGDLPADQKGGDCTCEQLAKCQETEATPEPTESSLSSSTQTMSHSLMYFSFAAMAIFHTVL
uniref:Plastocyanin-like domain-containing protein n=1 Tax=Amphora coffeiformis TaxID=265554 RepID=A0A7S3L011_9STRA